MNSKESKEAAGLEIIDAEVVETNALTAITRGEVDIQVVTAKRYPRSINKCMKDAETLATITKETAESCFYALPRGKGAKKKNIEGPSIRLAEIMASSWGNLRCEARIIDEGAQEVTAQAAAWDVETNVAIRIEAKRRITYSDGSRYNKDMILMTQNAAISIALRNAIFKVVPRSVVDHIYRSARRVAFGDAKTMIQRRGDMVATFGKLGVGEDRILAAVERDSLGDVAAEDMSVLLGLLNAIRAEETTVDAAFPEVYQVDVTPEQPEDNLQPTPSQQTIDKNLKRAKDMGALDKDPPAEKEPEPEKKKDKRLSKNKPVDADQVAEIFAAVKGLNPEAGPADVVQYCRDVLDEEIVNIDNLTVGEYKSVLEHVEQDREAAE